MEDDSILQLEILKAAIQGSCANPVNDTSEKASVYAREVASKVYAMVFKPNPQQPAPQNLTQPTPPAPQLVQVPGEEQAQKSVPNINMEALQSAEFQGIPKISP